MEFLIGWKDSSGLEIIRKMTGIEKAEVLGKE
jgi:hypothetical protein